MLPESTFTLLFDLRYPLHSLDRGLDELSVIPNGDIASFLELDDLILGRSENFGKLMEKEVHTIVISFPAALREALVYPTLRGFRFIM
jgi:hypothetical protein